MRTATSPGRDPDRLFPVDPITRDVARELYTTVADSPILSPHGHVPAAQLLRNEAFTNPADLLITPDHYVTRLLHAQGVPLESLGLGETSVDPRDVWSAFSQHWHVFAGTASGYWIADTLSTLFGIDEELSPDNAVQTYDAVAEVISRVDFRPRALAETFNLEVLATTDDPLDDLDAHAQLSSDGDVATRVLPTFRPDAYLDPTGAHFTTRAVQLLDAVPGSTTTIGGYLDALRARRAHFIAHGATSADHGVAEPHTVALDVTEAESLFQRAVAGTSTPEEARTLRGYLLLESARMSAEDGLVMTIHPGVLRGHHGPTGRRFGPDTGHDIPVRTEFTRNLRPLLEELGTRPGFHLVLFTVDETTFSRELAPLAGFYPSVYVGAPWWFLDAPDAILRFREAVTETAGFYRTSGFIDDTRAFLSIPARHDASRRLDAAYVARLVREGRLSSEAAHRIVRDLVDEIPRAVFKLGSGH